MTTRARQLAASLEQVDVARKMELIDQANQAALYFEVVDDTMCLMHDDGSVNLIESAGGRAIAVEVLSAESVLRVLAHYRPFDGLFPSPMNWSDDCGPAVQ